jgi:class 3 adenylate cyclase
LSSQANFRRADPKYSIDCAHLGIVLGDRRKLLRAIRELDVAPVVAPADAAERRQLTLMFCDLLGSTTLSASVDPEDLCAVRRLSPLLRPAGRASRRLCRQVHGRRGARLFGYRQAREHDAEHAVEAGLALSSSSQRFDGLPLTALLAL